MNLPTQNPAQIFVRIAVFVSLLPALNFLALVAGEWQIGASRIDVTPTEPVRLSGYAARVQPATEKDSNLFVRSFYMAHTDKEPLLVVSLDAIGISAAMTETINRTLESEFGMSRAQIALCTTHSHTAPHLDGVLTNLFAEPLSPAELEASKRYTKFLVDSAIESARQAIKGAVPGTITVAEDQADFAINRRVVQSGRWANFGTTPEGPVDRRVRVLSARKDDGDLLAVVYQYACHCTSISPDRNRVSADWAGMSAELIESQNAGLIAVPVIGTGADSNPNPRGEFAHAQSHAQSMAEAVTRAIKSDQEPLHAPEVVSFAYAGLEFNRPAPSSLQGLLQDPNRHIQNRARGLLEILKFKDRIPESYPAPVHFWGFGTQLAWVFLGGEVVVDYQIRLERELSQFTDVWVAAYVDDVFAYVASERLLKEGGYEVDSSMVYYNQPGPWVSGTEEKLVRVVLDLQTQTRNLDRPLTKSQALASIQVPEGFRIEQMAAEPLVFDPINISFGADGKVWVLEMPDYPNGGERSGRVICLEDKDQDGVLETSTVFLSDLPFVSGIYAWRDGVVVACAPEVFFAKDTDGDGMADEKRVILSGFALANPQHRVHGFTYGLDHKLHFGPGDGTKAVTLHRLDGSVEEVDIRGCDLAIDPDRHELSLETGETQFIRSHDGWGNWFGNDNTHPIYQYVADRNWGTHSSRHFAGQTHSAGMVRYLTQPVESPVVYPLSQALDRFNDPLTANRYTSVCSTILNLSHGNGDGMFGQAIVCEPVHNLVSRLAMVRDGFSWRAERLPEDSSSEWVRSSDPWFRPVRVVNAPDGSIWIADMYRRVIEHPTWIPEEWLARLDVYAGKEQGRLYRVYHESSPPQSPPNVAGLSTAELVGLLGHNNVAIADWAQQNLVWRIEDGALKSGIIVTELSSANPQVRVRAFSLLSYVGALEENQAIELLLDRDERVANYVAGQMLRSGQVSKRVVASMVARAGMSDSIDPLLAMRLVIGLANYGDTTDREPIRKSCDLLLANSSLRGFEIALEFINPDRVGLIVEELIQRDDLRGTGYLNRLVPKLPSSELTRIVGLIVGHQGARPAWHYLLTRQLASSAGVTELENELIDRIYAESKKIVSSSEGTLALKLAAWELYSSRLIDDSQAEVGELLERLANSDEAFVEVVVSGVYKLGEASRIALLRSSRTWPRPLRRSVISNFVGNPQGIRLLMESLDRGELKADMVEPSQIEVLRRNAQEVYAKSVVKWFGSDDAGDRKEAIDRFEKNWPAQFEIAQGKMLYETHCAKCHRGQVVDGLTAPPIGPSLQALSHWTNRAWLEAIIDPSKSVDDRYKRSLIRTKEDLVFSGLKIQESDEFLELVLADGRVEKIARDDIEDIKESNQSLMPDGFEKLLTPEQMAQIVTYLRRGGD